MPTLAREEFALESGPVDESGPYPVIKGCLLCGLVSEHGYDYPTALWTDDVLRRYEGISSYAGHKPGVRDPAEKVGWFRNVRRRADGRPEADFYLEPDHELTPRLVRAAKHNPKGYALSHQAFITKPTRAGSRAVEGIGQVVSVDVVSRGGTTGGIFEHGTGVTKMAVKLTEYVNKLGPKCDVGQLLKLRVLVKEDGIGDVDMPADAPPPDAAATTGEDGVDSAFLAAAVKQIKDCMDEAGDPAMLKKCLGKLKKLLMAHGEIKAEDAPDETPAAKPTETAEKEKAEEAARVAAAKATDPWVLIAECEAEKLTPSSLQLEALKGMTDKTKRVAFIREQKGLSKATDPKSVGRDQLVKEHGAGSGAPASGIEEARQTARRHAMDFQGVAPSTN